MVLFTYDDYCNYKNRVTIKLEEESENYTYNHIKDAHDKMYRDILNDKTEFSLFLNVFLNIKVTSEDLINYNNAFITEDFKNRRSDIVYNIKNKPIYIFLEHQSSIDYSINYRILEYYYYILKDTVESQKLKMKHYKFPVIIPILLYTGPNKWKFVPNIGDKQINLNDKELDYNKWNFKKWKLNFKYEFVNIHNYTIDELLNINSMVAYALATDKCKCKNELLDVLYKVCSNITGEERKEKIIGVINYILKDFLETSTRKDLLNKLEKGDNKDMKYAWDYVREDILKEREQQRKEGFINGVKEIISKMLKNGESIDKIQLYSGFSIEEIEKIKEELKLA